MNHIEIIEITTSDILSSIDYKNIKEKLKYIFDICKEINSESINIKYKIILNISKTLDYKWFTIYKLINYLSKNEKLIYDNIDEVVFKITKKQENIIKMIDKYYKFEIKKKIVYI